MSDTAPNPEAGMSTEQPAAAVPQPDANQVTIDKATLEALQANAALTDEIRKVAEEAGYDDPNEYVQAVEAKAWENMNDDTTKAEPTTPTPTTPAVPATTPAAPTTDPEALKRYEQQIASSSNASLQALLTSHYMEFKTDQKDVPEAERIAHDKKALTKIITGEYRPMVTSLAPKFGDNLYAAAHHVATIQNVQNVAVSQAQTSTAAKTAAAQTASINTGGPAAAPATMTEEEKHAAWNQEQADLMAPDDPPIMGAEG